MQEEESQEESVDELMLQLGMTMIKRRRGIRQSKEEKNRKANEARKNKKRIDPEYKKRINDRHKIIYHTRIKGTEKEKIRVIDKHYRKNYGITRDEAIKLSELQNGLCAICGSNNNKRSLCVDHDHSTGKIRQMLCTSCNAGIGNFKENSEIILKALEYLKKHKAMEK